MTRSQSVAIVSAEAPRSVNMRYATKAASRTCARIVLAPQQNVDQTRELSYLQNHTSTESHFPEKRQRKKLHYDAGALLVPSDLQGRSFNRHCTRA